MSRRSSLRSSSPPASGSTSLSSNPNQTPETPPPVNGQPNGHRSSGSQSGFKGNDDVEKQLSGAVQASTLDSEVGSTRLDPVQGNHGPTGKTQDHPIPSDPLTAMPSKLDQYNDFWNAYNKEADKEDSELIKSLEDDLNTLLIFAGLFSATNTAFIIESYRDLKQDQSELTNNLLRNMMRTMHQSSFKEADLLLDYGGPSRRAIVVNLFFFASLCCSLFTAFGAVIAKQWLDHYGREIHISSPSARGMERQQKYVGLRKWKFQAVVETFPTLLQFSLFFFFIGLIEFLWQLNKGVTILVIVFSVVTTLLYVITHFIGILYPKSPFQTRLTTVLRNRLVRAKMPTAIEDQNRKMDSLQAQSVDWLHERTTNADTVGIISRAVLLLTDAAKKAIDLDHGGKMLAYLLRSSLYNGQVYLGISLEGLQSSLVVFHDLIAQWDKDKDIVHPSDEGNASFLQALSRELWKLLLKSEKMDRTAASTALAILEKLGPVKEDSVATHAEYLVDSLSKQCDRQDQLLHLALLHDAVPSQDYLFFSNDTASRHIPEVLAATMWGMDGKPDLDHRRVALRLTWFLRDTDEMYPQIQYLDFGRYLSLWRKSQVQLDHSVPLRTATPEDLYLLTLIRLLFRDQEKWSKELEEHDHFTQIEALVQKRSSSLEAQPLCWIAFILFACSPGRNGDLIVVPPQYYSEKLVKMVISQLNPKRLPWTTLSKETWYKDSHTAMLMQSLYGYMQMAYNYGQIAEGKVAEIFTLIYKELWDMLLRGTHDDIAISIALTTLEKLGPINRGPTRNSRITYLTESLGKMVTREDQLLLLTLLHDVLWTQRDDRLDLDAHTVHRHVPEVLATSMWGVNGTPDLDHRRVALRLSWFLERTDETYPQIQNLDFSRYLSLWRQSGVQPDHSVSLRAATLDDLYLRSLIRLLSYNQERWAKELDEHGHLTHIETIIQDGSTSHIQLLCSIAFIFLARVAGRNDDPSAPPSQYYSETRVNMVILQLELDRLSWIPNGVLGEPNHLTSMMQSLEGYIQTAHQCGRIPDGRYAEVLNWYKKLEFVIQQVIHL